MIRHTTAVHLLRAGVDINTIRAWLGHVSLDTTNIYAEVDLEMKAKGACSLRHHRRKARQSVAQGTRANGFLKSDLNQGGNYVLHSNANSQSHLHELWLRNIIAFAT